MNKLILLLIFASGTLTCGYSQDKLNQTQKLKTLCQVWGFLKYYHPEVAKGKFNWDQALLAKIPEIQNAANIEDISRIYLNWISDLGEIKKCKSCDNDTNNDVFFDKNFDLSWIQDGTFFTKELSEKLRFIETNRFQGKNYYVKAAKRIGNVLVTNEEDYTGPVFPSSNYRLLSLFRYWNIIEYFFPYKYMMDQKWNDALIEMIPKFLDAENESEYHLAMLEIVCKIDDGHGSFSSQRKLDFYGRNWIPVGVKFLEGKLVVNVILNDSLAKKNDLKIGDIILKVNDSTVSEIKQYYLKYVPASNMAYKLRSIANIITTGNKRNVRLTLQREGELISQTVERYPFEQFKYERNKNKEKYKILDGGIGYVNMKNIDGKEVGLIKEVNLMMDSLTNCKAIIFDLRNYPKNIVNRISTYLNPSKIEFVKYLKPDLSYPGMFKWEVPKKTGIKNRDPYKGKIVVLVSEKTKSAAEYKVMRIQSAPNVTTIGSQTAGADGNVSRFTFLGDHKTAMSGIGIFYSDGTITQRKGVKIDRQIIATIEGLVNKKDEILDAAIDFINQGN